MIKRANWKIEGEMNPKKRPNFVYSQEKLTAQKRKHEICVKKK
jgi:hypothetical protein